MAEKFLAKAREKMEEKGTVGSFSKAAHKHGMSTQAYAQKEKHAGGKLGKRAIFAANMKKIADKHKHGGSKHGK